MVSVEYHCIINIVLNSLLLVLIWETFASNVFSFNDYEIGVSKITHKIIYEDFPADVEISFTKFEKYACQTSQKPDVMNLCESVASLELGGFIYKTGCFVVICSILISIINLTLILFQKKSILNNIKNSHYITAGLYWIIMFIYFILSDSRNIMSSVNQCCLIVFDQGAFFMFLAGGLALGALGHFIYVKRFSDFEDLINKAEGLDYFPSLGKRTDNDEALDMLRNENRILQDDLKHKDREIEELGQKVNEYFTRIQNFYEEPSNPSQSSPKYLSSTKKRALRAGRQGGVETIETLKQENGNLRAIYAKEKHEWEEEKKVLIEKSDNEYFYTLINDLCLKTQELQIQLSGKETGDLERQELLENLKDIKSKVETFKKEAVDEEKKNWDIERNGLHQVINDLQSDLEKNKVLADNQESISELKLEIEKLQEDRIKAQESKKNLMEKINSMGLEIAKLEKELATSQEFKHKLETATSNIAYLQVTLSQKQEENEKNLKILKTYKDLAIEKDMKIEEIERIVRTSEYQTKSLNEQILELKRYLTEKDNLIKNEKEDARNKISNKEDEINMLSSQVSILEKELSLAKKSVVEDKSQDYETLKLEVESLEAKVLNLNGLLKKQREQNNSLETQFQHSELKNQELEEKLANAQDIIAKHRATISELKLKLEDHEQLLKDYQNSQSTIQELSQIIEALKSEIQSLKALIRSLETYKKDKEFYEKQYQDSLKELESIQASKRNLELELVFLSNLKTENSGLSSQISNLTDALEASKLQMSEYRTKFTSQEIEHDKERDELLYSLSKNKKEIAQLERKLKTQEDFLENELSSNQMQIEGLKDQVNSLLSQNETYKQETQRLNHLQSALKQQLMAKDIEISEISQGKEIQANNEQIKRLYEDQIEEMHKNLKDTQERLRQILFEKENLREDLAAKQAELQTVSEDFAAFQNQIYDSERKKSLIESHERFNFSRVSDNSLENSARSAHDMIIIESISPKFNNTLLDNVSKLRKEPPMTYVNVWKLFEEMMLDKCKMDRLELSMGRRPRTMTEYMLDFVYLHYGLKTIALKQLKALVASLEQLYKQSHPYGVLFCRFLGLFHPRPLAYQLSIYLLMIQEQFVALTCKIKEKPLNFAQIYEIAQYGGQASIIDIMELIQKICKSNREIGERIITAMHKERADKVELSILKICCCMARMGKTSDFIFEILNAERRGNGLEYQQFIDGIRYTLNIWVTQEEAEDLCSYIDQDEVGLITFDSWYAKVNFVEFAEKMYGKVAMITKADFLNALVEEYEFEVLQDYHILKQMIRVPVLNESSMSNILLKIDPNLEDEDLANLYQEAREQDSEKVNGVTANALCAVVLKHTIGGYGIGMFDVYSLDSSLPKTSTEGVRTELVVERDTTGKLEIDLRKRNK